MLSRLWAARGHSALVTGLVALSWLVFITCLHRGLSAESKSSASLRIGYMPVVANLSAPLLDEATRNTKGIRFQSMKFASFAEMAESLRNGTIDAGFMIAPLSVVLRQQHAAIKVVYIGNRNESTFVVSKRVIDSSAPSLAAKKIAVPMRFSGHNLALRRLLEQSGMQASDVDIVEMNPPDMPNAMASGALDGYFVGEPFAAKAVASGSARVFRRAEDIWPSFMCNLLVVREALISERPNDVALLVESAVRAGFFAKKRPHDAAAIAARYWGQPVELVDALLSDENRRIQYDRYIPLPSEFAEMADEMRRFGLIDSLSIDGLIDDRFARAVPIEPVGSLSEIVRASGGAELRADLR